MEPNGSRTVVGEFSREHPREKEDRGSEITEKMNDTLFVIFNF